MMVPFHPVRRQECPPVAIPLVPRQLVREPFVAERSSAPGGSRSSPSSPKHSPGHRPGSAQSDRRGMNVVINSPRAPVQITTAQATGPNSTATATSTANDPQLTSLLEELKSVLRREGEGETAEKVAHVTSLVVTPRPDETKLRKLWSAIKVAATTDEAVALVTRITPLLLGSGPTTDRVGGPDWEPRSAPDAPATRTRASRVTARRPSRRRSLRTRSSGTSSATRRADHR